MTITKKKGAKIIKTINKQFTLKEENIFKFDGDEFFYVIKENYETGPEIYKIKDLKSDDFIFVYKLDITNSYFINFTIKTLIKKDDIVYAIAARNFSPYNDRYGVNLKVINISNGTSNGFIPCSSIYFAKKINIGGNDLLLAGGGTNGISYYQKGLWVASFTDYSLNFTQYINNVSVIGCSDVLYGTDENGELNGEDLVIISTMGGTETKYQASSNGYSFTEFNIDTGYLEKYPVSFKSKWYLYNNKDKKTYTSENGYEWSLFTDKELICNNKKIMICKKDEQFYYSFNLKDWLKYNCDDIFEFNGKIFIRKNNILKITEDFLTFETFTDELENVSIINEKIIIVTKGRKYVSKDGENYVYIEKTDFAYNVIINAKKSFDFYKL